MFFMKKAFLMKKAMAVLLAATLVIGMFPSFNTSVKAANPYLPLWEHLPDGEPRVFEDPDNPGKYRAYIIGSHDTKYTAYCGPDIRAWSAPVEDLSNWRDEGSIFTFQDPASGLWDTMYAPDLVEVLRRDKDGKRTIKEYYLYPHSRGPGREKMVAKGSSPVGPFTPINLNEDGRTVKSGSILGFDPSVYIEYVDDPSDPDYEIGFRAYGYWGFQQSSAAELDQNTMYSGRPGKQTIDYFIPASESYGNIRDPQGTTYPAIYPGEDLKKFNFFEASSIRKVGNKYVMVYSGFSGPDYGLNSSNSTLRYAYGDTPLGPWKSGGVLVDSRAPVVNQAGTALQLSYSGHNTHGSIEEINNQWYVFYHRPPRGFGYARQTMSAPVIIDCDDKSIADGGKVTIKGYDPYAVDNIWTAKAGSNEYTGAEVTSEGFMIYGLDPYKYYSAGIASYLSDAGVQADSYDIWDDHAPLTDVKNNNIIGYKYFGFGGLDQDTKGVKTFEGTKPGNNTKFNLFLTPKTTSAFKVNVWLDSASAGSGTKIGEITVPANSASKVTQFSLNVSSFVDNLDKKNAIYLVAEGGSGNLFDLIGLGFSSDGKEIVRPEVPTVSIKVDGKDLELPAIPVRSTESNGITGYDIYEKVITLPYSTTTVPAITASASNKDVNIDIEQIKGPFGTAVVKFEYNGAVKTYNIIFNSDATYSISSASTPLSFGLVKGSYTQPAAQTVTVTNTGTGSVTLTQPTATNYDIGALSTTTLAGEGATATFTVRPKAGLKVGNYNGVITINGSDRTRTLVDVKFAVVDEIPTITITDQPTAKMTLTEGSISGGLFVNAKIEWPGESGERKITPNMMSLSTELFAEEAPTNTVSLPDVVAPNIGWSTNYIYNEKENMVAGQAFKLEFTVDLQKGTRFFVEAPQQPGNNGGFHPAMRNASGVVTDGPMSNGHLSADKEGVYNVTWYAKIGSGAYQLKTYNNPGSPDSVTMTNIKLTRYTGENDPSLKAGEWEKITATEDGTVESKLAYGDIQLPALKYQWYVNTKNSNTDGTAIEGATSATLAIPTTLTAGTYYYYAVVSAEGADSVPRTSNVSTVVVKSIQRTVTFNYNYTGAPANITRQINTNTPLGTNMPTSPTRTGFNFAGWFTAKTGGTKITANTIVTADITYFARWTALQHTVTFNPNNGKLAKTQLTRKVNHSTTVGNLPVPRRAGYIFTGWFTAAKGGKKITATSKITVNINYYAQWTKKPSKPKSPKATANSKSQITVSWKRVTNATGYEVVRATLKKGKFKKVTAIKKGSIVNFKNQKLKSNQNYFYKIRSYKTVNGKNVYSSYTKIVSAKTKK